MKDVSVQKEIKLLKLILKKAVKMGIKMPLDFIDFKPKFKIIEKEVIYLTWEELMKLYNLSIPEDGTEITLCDISGQYYKKIVKGSSSLKKTRDLFCFCCFTGLRYSDMAKLRKTDVKNDACEERCNQGGNGKDKR